MTEIILDLIFSGMVSLAISLIIAFSLPAVHPVYRKVLMEDFRD